MRRVAGAFLGALPGLISITMFRFIFYYVAAVVATKLFGLDFPEYLAGSSARSRQLPNRSTKITEALELATEHIEADMHSEMRALRSELQSMRLLLKQNIPQKSG